MTVKRVERNCDLFAKVCIKEVQTDTITKTVIKREIVYRDTTIYIDIPGKEVVKEIPVYINNGIVNSEISVLITPLARSTAQVINSNLCHELAQTDTVLLIKLDNALQSIKTLEKQNKILKEKYVVTVTENSNFAGFTIKWFIGSLVLIILGIGYLILKNKAKILGLIKRIS